LLEFQQRVVDEEKELGVKIHALISFVKLSPEYSLLPNDEKMRLTMQRNIMSLYRLVLQDRIANFYRT
jgi:hypothetical protein